MKGRRLWYAGIVAAALVFAAPAGASRPVVPALAVPRAHPAVPVGGQPFEVTFPVLNALTGSLLTNVTSVSFQPTIDGKPVQLQQTSFVAGYKAVAGVVWMTMKVPASTKPEVLEVKVTIDAGGRRATRVETYRIREAGL